MFQAEAAAEAGEDLKAAVSSVFWGNEETRTSHSTPWWHLWIMYAALTSDQLTQNLRASRDGVEDSGRV